MRAYRTKRLSQATALRKIHANKATAYDNANPEHEKMLLEFWDVTFPKRTMKGAQPTPISNRWKELGFQGDDPATDFRGMGILGLQNLIYFSKNYADEFRTLLSHRREYPMACAGINLTAMLLKQLMHHDGSVKGDSELFNLMCRDGREEAFEVKGVDLTPTRIPTLSLTLIAGNLLHRLCLV